MLSDKSCYQHDDGEDGVGELEACARQESDKGAPGGAHGLAAFFAAQQFASKCADEGPEYNTYESGRSEGEADDRDY